MKVTSKMLSLMKRLPCGTFDVPLSMCVFSKLEDAGLARYEETLEGKNSESSYARNRKVVWFLTDHGKNVLISLLKDDELLEIIAKKGAK